jgi:DNA-directed RNA polymerase specialized sigma24 family protein
MTPHQDSSIPDECSSPDEPVMLAVRDGDIHELRILFDRYQRRIFAFFLRLTGDRGASEDLQEVFLRILKYRSTFNGNIYIRRRN